MHKALEEMRHEAGDDDISQAIFDFLAGNPIPYLKEIQRLETQEEKNSKALKSKPIQASQLSSRLEVMLRINADSGAQPAAPVSGKQPG